MTDSAARPYWLRLLLATLPAFIVVVGLAQLLRLAGWRVPLPITQGVLLFSFALLQPAPPGSSPRAPAQRVGVAILIGVFMALATWALELNTTGR